MHIGIALNQLDALLSSGLTRDEARSVIESMGEYGDFRAVCQSVKDKLKASGFAEELGEELADKLLN